MQANQNAPLDPELVRLLEKIPEEALRDYFAIHGIGSLRDQVNAKARRAISDGIAELKFMAWLFGFVIIPALLLFILIGFLCQWWPH
jgi:hypothetical protein